MHLAGEQVEAVVNTGVSASIEGKCLAHKLKIWKKARKVKVWQGDRTILEEHFIMNTSFKIMDSLAVLRKFAIDAEVLDMENRDIILGLSWLIENGFLVNTQDRCLRNVNTS